MICMHACFFALGGSHRRHYTWRVPQVPRADQMGCMPGRQTATAASRRACMPCPARCALPHAHVASGMHGRSPSLPAAPCVPRCPQRRRILHTLPLHHVHGIVNALLCPLRAGTCSHISPRVWCCHGQLPGCLPPCLPPMLRRLCVRPLHWLHPAKCAACSLQPPPSPPDPFCAGACVEALQKFSPQEVWARLQVGGRGLGCMPAHQALAGTHTGHSECRPPHALPCIAPNRGFCCACCACCAEAGGASHCLHGRAHDVQPSAVAVR